MLQTPLDLWYPYRKAVWWIGKGERSIGAVADPFWTGFVESQFGPTCHFWSIINGLMCNCGIASYVAEIIWNLTDARREGKGAGLWPVLATSGSEAESYK